jgi:hypothetical protein
MSIQRETVMEEEKKDEKKEDIVLQVQDVSIGHETKIVEVEDGQISR